MIGFSCWQDVIMTSILSNATCYLASLVTTELLVKLITGKLKINFWVSLV
jgi:hypothetical protein